MPRSAVAGQEHACRVRLRDAAGTRVAGNVPVRIVVRDAHGHERPEYGGARVIRDGVLEMSIRLGVNDPPGRWRMEAREAWTGIRQEGRFRVVAGRDR
jgi:uncharacterized protein YfaS (alpha-2-macroglobulin family)